MIEFIKYFFKKKNTSRHPENKPSDLWNQVVCKWKDEGVDPRSGASLADIANFQLKYGVVLPNDFVDYLRNSDGSSEYQEDNELLRFWTLAEIKPVHEVYEESSETIYPKIFAHSDCFVFADVLLNSDLYAIRLTGDEGQPAPVFHGAGVQIAPSFREFMQRYVDDAASLVY